VIWLSEGIPQSLSPHSVVKYCETIADNLSKAGWSLCCVSAVDSSGRTMFIAEAHRDEASVSWLDERRNLNGLAFESDRRE